MRAAISSKRRQCEPAWAQIVYMTDTCLFAHYDPNDRLADHVLHYLNAIRRAGFAITVISTARLGEAERGKLAAIGADLMLRENVGLDFGSWAAGLASLRDATGNLRIEGKLLLANDSVFGPLGDLREALEKLSCLPGDVHGMVESGEIAPHLQSWFLLFSPAAYRHPSFERTFGQDFTAMPKSEIIRNGEISLSANLREAGLTCAALASDPPRGGVKRRIRSNPMQFLWRALIERDGVPFLKIELLRDNPAEIASLTDWPRIVRARSPVLFSLIQRYLADQPTRSSRSSSTPKRRAISREAFVIRDDEFARRGNWIAGWANFLCWRLLYLAQPARRVLFGGRTRA